MMAALKKRPQPYGLEDVPLVKKTRTFLVKVTAMENPADEQWVSWLTGVIKGGVEIFLDPPDETVVVEQIAEPE